MRNEEKPSYPFESNYNEYSSFFESNELLTHKGSSSSSSYFDLLGPDATRLIFEHLLDDFASIRLACKALRKDFDDFNLAICSNIFPGFTKATFSHWNNSKEYLKYQLILLTNAFVFNSKIISFKYEESDTQLDLMTDFHLRHNATKLIRLLKSKNFDMCLKLTNAFLKLKIVVWADVYKLLFSNSTMNILRAWSLGLTTIAREMALYNMSTFLTSIGISHEGLLRPIKARKYALSRFMISLIRSGSIKFTASQWHFENLIGALILAKFEDLLNEIYEMNKNYSYSFILYSIAKEGNIEYLRVSRCLAKGNSHSMASAAAFNGHLDFLKELDALGLLENDSLVHNKDFNLAIHGAVSNGHTKCLEFLVNRFGTQYLDFDVQAGMMPIHLAASSDYPETLLAIIRLYPYYIPRRSSKIHPISPLRFALENKLPANSKILIESFPELVDFQHQISKHTSIHLAIRYEQHDILELLLKLAKAETITATTGFLESALHLAANLNNWSTSIRLLLNTGLFTAMERNSFGETPVMIFKESKPKHSSPSELMRIFNLQSKEKLTEALTIRDKKSLTL